MCKGDVPENMIFFWESGSRPQPGGANIRSPLEPSGGSFHNPFPLERWIPSLFPASGHDTKHWDTRSEEAKTYSISIRKAPMSQEHVVSGTPLNNSIMEKGPQPLNSNYGEKSGKRDVHAERAL